jgi:hypothetical protein
MNDTGDTNQTAASDPPGDGGPFGPREAATLLEQTTRHAHRRLEPYPPWLLVIRAVLVLAAYGAVWLSVRGQHPYKWPTVAAILIVNAFGVVNLGATLAVAKRATAGVSGRSRLRPAEITVMTVAWVAPWVVMVVLAVAGVSNAIVYGLYPATVPLMVAGLAYVGIAAARKSWRGCGTGLAVAVVGVVGIFAGPAGAWAVAGVGLCVTLLGSAAATTWLRRTRQPHLKARP